MRVNHAAFVELENIHALNALPTQGGEQASITIPEMELPQELSLTVVAVKLTKNAGVKEGREGSFGVFVIGLCNDMTDINSLMTELVLVRDKERHENQIIMRSKFKSEEHFLLGFILMNTVSN